MPDPSVVGPVTVTLSPTTWLCLFGAIGAAIVIFLVDAFREHDE